MILFPVFTITPIQPSQILRKYQDHSCQCLPWWSPTLPDDDTTHPSLSHANLTPALSSSHKELQCGRQPAYQKLIVSLSFSLHFIQERKERQETTDIRHQTTDPPSQHPNSPIHLCRGCCLKYRVRPVIALHLYRLDLIKQPSFSFCY